MRCTLAVLLFCSVAPDCLGQLTVVNARFHEYEGGPLLSSEYQFRPGEIVFLSFQIAGFKTAGEEDDKVQLTWQVKATDPASRLIAEPKEGKIEVELAPEDKKGKWLPRVRYNVAIPAAAAAGTYVIHIAAEDLIGNQQTSNDAGFTVGGRAAGTPADSLTLRDFQFLRSEKEDDVLPAEGSFRPGDTVWARFEIAGFKYGTKNRYSVGYGLTLIDDTGKVIFEQPKAATDSEESFYPRQFVPALLNLKLDPKIKPGAYTLKLHVIDSIGNQEIAGSFPFRIEN
jgi:hypothetical protein